MFTSIAAASYLVAAFSFLALFALLLTRWRGRLPGMGLACMATAIWAVASAVLVLRGQALSLATAVLEIVRNAAWAFFLLSTLRKQCAHQASARAAGGRLTAATAGICLLLLATSVHQHLAPGTNGFMLSIAGRVAMAVLAMLLVEQLFRNTAQEERWAIKFACLGIGGLFAYDFYLYSDALLFRRISPEIWAARGAVDALIVPLIAVAAARNPHWSATVAVSRTMLFHSAVVFGSAVYLLSMAAAGYFLRMFGGSWGAVMQVAFLFGAVILLCAALFSGSLRASVKVFISKHFYRYRYDYRDEWLRFTRALSEPGTDSNERVVQSMAKLTESSAGALFICRDETGCCEPVAHWNMRAAQVSEPQQGPLCRYLASTQWVIDLREYKSRPEKYEGLVLPSWLQGMRRAWLVVPLLLEGKLFGFVLLGQPRSKMKLDWETIDLLKVAGAQAASYLAHCEAQNALMVARQFESYTRMSTFIVHDLKNLISQLSLLLANAERHKHNPAFQDDMLETIGFSVQKMKQLLQKLSQGPTTDSTVSVGLSDLLRQVVQLKLGRGIMPSLHLDDPGLFVLADQARLERVIGHLVQNALEATPSSGTVAVRLLKHGDHAVVEISDTGHGMTEEFIRERLFKPFESTKTAGMGIGAFESRVYIRQLGGEIDVSSTPSVGTTFRVTLPIHRYDNEQVMAAA